MPAIQTPNAVLFSDIQPGRWVAISKDQRKVIGTGRTMKEAVRKAEANGEKQPFITRVPLKNSALIF
jgi:hypothetical protein